MKSLETRPGEYRMRVGDYRVVYEIHVRRGAGHRVAVVTGVPVEECPACGEIWLDEQVALRLDALLTEMLATETVAVLRPRTGAVTCLDETLLERRVCCGSGV